MADEQDTDAETTDAHERQEWQPGDVQGLKPLTDDTPPEKRPDYKPAKP